MFSLLKWISYYIHLNDAFQLLNIYYWVVGWVYIQFPILIRKQLCSCNSLKYPFPSPGLKPWPHDYLLTPCRVLLEKLTGLQLVKKFPAFHGTRKFITALTSFRHLSLSWASPIQSIYPHPTSWRSILILSTHLRLGLPSGLFPEQASRMWMFLNISVLQRGVVSTSPDPQVGGPPLVGCQRLLIQYIRSYPL